MKKLTDFIKEQLGAHYTISELEEAINKNKLNKAPGPDGFSNEFFKFLLDDLKFWIHRYILECFSNDKILWFSDRRFHNMHS